VHLKLADHERCLTCGAKAYVIDSVRNNGYRRRTHKCRGCGKKWKSYQSRLNPRKVKIARPPAPVER
jgi:NAD-dependent SIR2 family protein deacetylase